VFEQLEMTEIALWVGESVWGYPIMLSLHALGLAILVGIFSMFYLRILGAFSGISLPAFLPLVKFAWVGFVINAVWFSAVYIASDNLCRKPALLDQNWADIIGGDFCCLYSE